MGDEMFFVIPTNKVQIGDIILVDGKPKCVIETNKKVISVIDYENSEIRQVLPERHIFMGNVYFYGKIVSMFGNMFGKSGGAKNMIKMMMMSQIMGGNNGVSNGSSNGGFMQNIGQMAAMSMFMGGDNPFNDMFDFDFGESNISFNEDEDDDVDDDKNVDDEVPVKKNKKARKE